MKASGNGKPEVCASNLLRIVRGEVPYDRVRGRDPSLIDKANAMDEASADAEWLLKTFEPRVTVESVETVAEVPQTGEFATLVNFKRKENEA